MMPSGSNSMPAIFAVVIPSWLVFPLMVFGLIAAVVIVLLIIAKFSVNSKKLAEAGSRVEEGDLAGACEDYKAVLRSSVGAVEFKILPSDASAFEKAVSGLQGVYEAADQLADLDSIVKLHTRWLQLQRKQRKSATKDYSDQMNSVRKKAIALIDRLPEVG